MPPIAIKFHFLEPLFYANEGLCQTYMFKIQPVPNLGIYFLNAQFKFGKPLKITGFENQN